MGWIETAVGPVAVISGETGWSDRLGGWKARWGIGRMTYIVPPGLYAIGSPNPESPVVVTANYKMSYDLVRSVMASHSVWLLVLETYGINVWCAAGKGTFGTGELVRRIGVSGLEKIVGHRTLLLPVMAAAGVKAVEVKKRTGFEVRFATLRIQDLPEYISHGMHADSEMRELTFSFAERAVLAPMELIIGLKSLFYLGLPLSLVCGFGGETFSFSRVLMALALYLVAVLCGTVITPVLLPWIPGRIFAVKGFFAGLLPVYLCISLADMFSSLQKSTLILTCLAVSSFYAMNFTGSTPFTSPSGVRREMKLALPLMASALVLAAICLIVGSFMS